MSNILEQEDYIKGLPDSELQRLAQQPDGQIPEFLTLSEINRRTEMRKNYEATEQPKMRSIASNIMAEGLASVSPQRSSAPPALPTPALPVGGGTQGLGGMGVQGYNAGGVIKMQEAGQFPRGNTAADINKANILRNQQNSEAVKKAVQYLIDNGEKAANYSAEELAKLGNYIASKEGSGQGRIFPMEMGDTNADEQGNVISQVFTGAKNLMTDKLVPSVEDIANFANKNLPKNNLGRGDNLQIFNDYISSVGDAGIDISDALKAGSSETGDRISQYISDVSDAPGELGDALSAGASETFDKISNNPFVQGLKSLFQPTSARAAANMARQSERERISSEKTELDIPALANQFVEYATTPLDELDYYDPNAPAEITTPEIASNESDGRMSDAEINSLLTVDPITNEGLTDLLGFDPKAESVFTPTDTPAVETDNQKFTRLKELQDAENVLYTNSDVKETNAVKTDSSRFIDNLESIMEQGTAISDARAAELQNLLETTRNQSQNDAFYGAMMRLGAGIAGGDMAGGLDAATTDVLARKKELRETELALGSEGRSIEQAELASRAQNVSTMAALDLNERKLAAEIQANADLQSRDVTRQGVGARAVAEEMLSDVIFDTPLERAEAYVRYYNMATVGTDVAPISLQRGEPEGSSLETLEGNLSSGKYDM